MKNSTRILQQLLLSGLVLITTASFALDDALKIRITGNNYSDETVIRFLNDATTAFDGSYDAWKLFSSNNQVPSIYTRLDSFSELSINAYPELDTLYSFDLFAWIRKAGTYTISGSELGSFAPGVGILMKDLQTGLLYNLRDTTAYSFTMAVNTKTSAARFRIYFTPVVTTGLAASAQQPFQLNVYHQGDQLAVQTPASLHGSKVGLSVYSTAGQLVCYREYLAEESAELVSLPASAIYILRLSSGSAHLTRTISYSK